MSKCSVPPTPIIMNLRNTKSLLRAIESARQMSTNIDMEVKNRKQLDRKFLKENLQSLWVDGILVLDEEGKKVL